ncbi:MAG: hypothetical protein GH152_00165 [Dehalococcoidia bacterium]|nr:hypothetical protein [Dehalococcoidia bacterium]
MTRIIASTTIALILVATVLGGCSKSGDRVVAPCAVTALAATSADERYLALIADGTRLAFVWYPDVRDAGRHIYLIDAPAT